MKYFSWIYIFLYASYVILGPHYIARTIRGDRLEIVDTPMTLISRIFFLSYIAYLATAYFFLNPNGLTWLIAIVINATAIIGYTVRWFPIRNVDPYYWTGLVAHILVSIPPNIWNGFRSNDGNVAVLANCSDIPHDPSEILRLPFDNKKIKYDWSL